MSVLDFAIGVFTSLVLAGAAIGAPAPHRFFDSEGVRIHYIDTGGADGADGAGADASDREPVVLIHGFSRDLELTWVEPGLVDALDDSYRVIALDCRGHGKSDCPRDDEDDAYGAHMIEDVGRLLDHLEIDRAHLVGYSMGGRMALKLAALKPRRARSVVLIGAGGARPQDDHRLWDHLAAALEAGEGIMPLLRTILPELPEDELRAINDQTLSRNDAPALAAVARHYRAFATSEARHPRARVGGDRFQRCVQGRRRCLGPKPARLEGRGDRPGQSRHDPSPPAVTRIGDGVSDRCVPRAAARRLMGSTRVVRPGG